VSALVYSAPIRVADPLLPSDETARAREVNQKLLMLLGHELGSPLTFILAYLRLWQERVTGVDRDELNLVVQQALTLKSRLDDLMLLDQLETGMWRLAPEPLDISRIIEQVEDVRRAELLEKNLTLEIELSCYAPVLADRAMLLRALNHLVENACKFSNPNSTITIRSECEGEFCRITVADQGIGIPVEQQARIFEPFFQVDLTRARRYNGLGIGLKLVRAIVEKLGGCVQVKSAEGEGSAFILTLPLA